MDWPKTKNGKYKTKAYKNKTFRFGHNFNLHFVLTFQYLVKFNIFFN